MVVIYVVQFFRFLRDSENDEDPSIFVNILKFQLFQLKIDLCNVD